MICNSSFELKQTLKSHISKNNIKWIKACSYGVHINSELLELINEASKQYHIDTEVMLGIGNLAKKLDVDFLMRSLVKKYDKIKFYASLHSHSKYILCSDGFCAIGSINFTDSEWYETTIFGPLCTADYVKILDMHNKKKKTNFKVVTREFSIFEHFDWR